MARAQIKLFESIAVLVVFAFLLVFGVNFYFGIQKASVEREIVRATQLQVFSMAQKTAYLPELDCAIAGIKQEACIDVSKLAAFAAVLNDPDAAKAAEASSLYFPVFGWSTVRVKGVFPPGNNLDVVLYDNPLVGYASAFKVQIPILLHNASANKDDFGYIEVTNYAK